LAEKVADRGSNFYSEVLVGVENAALSIYITQHRRGNVDGKDIIAVR